MKTTMNFLNNISQLFLVALTLVCSLGMNSTAFAQASLAAENTIDDIQVTTKYGKQKVYTVFQDNGDEKQWYYMPNELRVAEEVDVNGKVRPKMTILRYQYQDIKTKESLEGGILVASFTYAMEPEVVEDVKNQIIKANRKFSFSWGKGLSSTSNIRLSAIPLKSSDIDFLSDSNKFLGDKDAKVNFKGATSASQEIVISYDLTKLGASVFKELASSKGGIPIRANITYNGLTAPCGYKIKGNWDNVYSYFEKNSKIEAGVKLGPFKVGGVKTKQSLKETLNNIQGMEVEIVECENTLDSTGNGQNSDDQNMNDIIRIIQKEVFSDSLMSRAAELEKLQAMLVSTDNEDTKKRILDMMTEGKGAVKFGYQNSTKSVNKRRKGSINYNFARQRMVTRPTSFGGLLSFSKYGLDEETLLKEGYIIDVDVNKDFPSVIMGLPHINPDFDLRSITVEVSHKFSDGTIHSEARQWTEKDQEWTSPMGTQVDYLLFHMIREKDKSKVNEPEFDITIKVVSNIPNASFAVEETVKLNSGERFVDALELLTEQIIIDGSVLDFAKLTEDETHLAFAKVELQKGGLTIKKNFKPYYVNGTANPPNPLFLYVPKNNDPTSSKVTFYKKVGKTKKVESKESIELGENVLFEPEWPGEGE
ncbi:MAG: hypothetical protein ACI9AT_000519 [Ulvibacter sp.]|jgi:hypothetical protein